MKRLKPLIKMEMKPALLMAIYFLAINMISLVEMNSLSQIIIKRDLVDGISAFVSESGGSGWGSIFYENIRIHAILTLGGMLLLVYLSYRNDKHHEIGRFLKSLPYTMKERYLVKIGTGIGMFSVTYLIYGMGTVMLRGNFIKHLADSYEVTILSSVYQELFSSSQLISSLIVVFATVIGCYLFAVMFEYLVSPNFASVVIASLVACSPLFILANIELHLGNVGGIIYPLESLFSTLMMGEGAYGSVVVDSAAGWDYLNSAYYLDFVGPRMAIYLGIGAICVWNTLRLCKRTYLEESDYFISNKSFKVLFIAGVTVCGGFLVGDLYGLYLLDQGIGMYVALIVGAVVSGVIAYRIANMGRSNKIQIAKEV